MDRPSIITFDCYGTLVDWRRGITDAFAAEAASSGWRFDADEILALHAEIEPAVQEQSYVPYRIVLQQVAQGILEQLGADAVEDAGMFLPESVPAWPVFPDTNAALEALVNGGYRLGILSNIDDDLFDATRSLFTVDFDLVVTAEQVRSYKPAAGHFDVARSDLGTTSWLHAAQSYFHDVVPARTHGIPVVWINRLFEGALSDVLPDHEVNDMQGFAEWACSLT